MAAETAQDALVVAAALIGTTGTAVKGTTDVLGGSLGMDTKPTTDILTDVTNPLAGGVALVTGSPEDGAPAADLFTLGKAGVDAAAGKEMQNPAEVLDSITGALDAIRKRFSQPQPPPEPTDNLKAPDVNRSQQ